ncbi:MAG: hormogonium polysaccharide biosynthesis glycosyltransferase HpsE [Limnospira sp.]
MDFSVVIPTYNGAKQLPGVLEKLRSQTGTEEIDWEILVVDNNSSDETAKVVRELQSTWNLQVPLKYVFERRQGLTYARTRGIEETEGQFIGFLDDDNFPNSDWVLQAYLFGNQYPKAGIYGGQIHAVYQTEPPENFKRIEHLVLAMRESDEQPFRFNPELLQLPSGAGLVLRRKALLESIDLECIASISRGDNDYELSLYLYKNGWEIWYNPTLHVDHLIPPERLEKKYVLSLAYRYGLYTFGFRVILAKNLWQKFLLFFRVMFGGFKRVILHLKKHKTKVKSDLANACELNFFWASAISPIYYYLNKI